MRKNKIFFLFFLLSVQVNFLFAERSAGICNMKEELDGNEVLELAAGVDFYSIPYGKSYQHIWIDAWVRTRSLYDGIRLNIKTKIYNEKLKPIGKVLQSFNPMKLLEERDSMTHIQISGFLENASIDNDFIPENDLSNLLLKATPNARLEYFELFLLKYNFSKWIEDNKYVSFSINEPDFVRQNLKPRILMIFYKKELIAIFHTRTIKVKLYDSIEMGSEYKMIYNSKFTEHTKNEMVTIYKKKLQRK